MILRLYRGVMTVGAPLLRVYLKRRLARGKEDPTRFAERLGVAGRLRPEGRLVWVHGASVGEAVSALPLVARIVSAPGGGQVLMTTGTVTSAKVMAERLPEGAFHQYLPVDHPDYVRRFVDHWRPDLAIWVESEFWPNLLGETARRAIPQVLINGRVSARSYRRWSGFFARREIGRLLGAFSLCLGQSVGDAERLAALGAQDSRCLGNLKYAAPPLPVNAADHGDLAARLAGRPVWLGASTHPGEEVALARIHTALKAVHPGLLTVIAPRHPERGDQIARDLRAMGLRVARRSQGDAVAAACDIYLADTIGELGLFYRLAPIAFIGKSLLARGGQNPIEAARFGCAIVFGPAMENFADIAADLLARGAARRVGDVTDLERALDVLFVDAQARSAMGDAAQTIAKEHEQVLDRVFEALTPFLEVKGGGS